MRRKQKKYIIELGHPVYIFWNYWSNLQFIILQKNKDMMEDLLGHSKIHKNYYHHHHGQLGHHGNGKYRQKDRVFSHKIVQLVYSE